MKKTMLIAVEIEEATAKMRTHGVGDDEADMDLNVWAGLLPLKLTPQLPVDDAVLKNGVSVPDYVKNYKR